MIVSAEEGGISFSSPSEKATEIFDSRLNYTISDLLLGRPLPIPKPISELRSLLPSWFEETEFPFDALFRAIQSIESTKIFKVSFHHRYSIDLYEVILTDFSKACAERAIADVIEETCLVINDSLSFPINADCRTGVEMWFQMPHTWRPREWAMALHAISDSAKQFRVEVKYENFELFQEPPTV